MAKVTLGPATLDIAGVRAGDANQFQITLTTDGNPLDLTGMTAAAQARVTATDPVSLSAVIDVVDPTAGVLLVAWPGDDVRDWLSGQSGRSGVWDLQLAIGEAEPVTVLAGSFGAQMDVTR